MNILFYTILFIIGCVIGGLWAVQTRDIPKVLDLKRVFYTNKKNENLISEIIYILLGGISTVVFANEWNIHMESFDITNFIIFIFAMLYISTLVIIAGIDKNYLKIDKKTLAFGIVCSIVYMLYLCIVDLASLYLSTIYLITYTILLMIDSFLLRRFAKDSYIVNLLMLFIMIMVFTDLRILIYTSEMALVAVLLNILLLNLQKKKNGNRKIKIKEIPIGFFVTASNVIVLFMVKIFENYLIIS